MLSVYVFSLILGGIFVVLSVLGGFGDADADFDVDADMDADFDMDVDVDADADFDIDVDADADVDMDADGEGTADLETRLGKKKFRPWFSFKFYTFALAFFGLTGVLLHLVNMGESLLGISAAVVMGLLSGLGASYVMYYGDKASEVSKAAGEREFLGAPAKVILPIREGGRGRVRVEIDGRTVDMRAESEDEEIVLDMNDQCFVLGIEDGVAQVLDMKALEAKKKKRQG